MKSDACNSAALEISTKNPAGYTPPRTHTHGQSSKFRTSAGWVRIEVSIDVEEQIDRAAHQLHTVTTKEEKQAAWALLKRLHALRSPVTVDAMEVERGLR